MPQWDKLIARIRDLSKDLNDDPIKRVYVERVRDVVEGKEGVNDDT